MTEIAVELREVSKTYSSAKTGGVAAVNKVSLQIFQGEFFTVLGPSGCGKTTVLRMIAGFEKPSGGEIYIQGKLSNRLPPHRRPVNTVFQHYALFPHMTVAQNVEYGLKLRRVPQAERQQRVAEMLALVRMDGMEQRKPAELSGGQQQRVALARALVNRPAVLLLDEPLGALDLKLRSQMEYELKQLQTRLSITFIYITHDQQEALTMSDRIAVLKSGQVLQVDSPTAIYAQPVNRFVAGFIGENNFLRGKVRYCGKSSASVDVAGELIQVNLRTATCEVDQQVFVAIRPERIEIASDDELPKAIQEQGYMVTPKGIVSDPVKHRRSRDRRGHIATLYGIIDSRMFIGPATRYVVRLKDKKTVIVRVQNTYRHESKDYAPGDQVKIWFYMEDAFLFAGAASQPPPESGRVRESA